MKYKNNKIDYPFIGYDYSELYYKWGLNPEQYEDAFDLLEVESEIFRLYIVNYLFHMYFYDKTQEPSRVMRAFCKDARKFLIELSKFKFDEDRGNFWKSLSDIKNDFNFLKLFIPLVGYMWV